MMKAKKKKNNERTERNNEILQLKAMRKIIWQTLKSYVAD